MFGDLATGDENCDVQLQMTADQTAEGEDENYDEGEEGLGKNDEGSSNLNMNLEALEQQK